MSAAFGEKIEELVQAGWHINSVLEHQAWQGRVRYFLAYLVGEETAREFDNIGSDKSDYTGRDMQIGMLEGLALKEARESAEQVEKARSYPDRVFLVHGHDKQAEQEVALFLERIGLPPIILREEPSTGHTLIEKFELFSIQAGFAVVLLTPDDMGGAQGSNTIHPRARQNVILELGYFLGLLRRSRVVALYKQGLEIPSDYHGVVYVPFDDGGRWKTKLAQEFNAASLKFNLAAVLSS